MLRVEEIEGLRRKEGFSSVSVELLVLSCVEGEKKD